VSLRPDPNPRPQPGPAGRDLMLVYRARDDDDEEQFRPLEWGLIRRLFTYAGPVRRKLIALSILTVIRAAQLPMLPWLVSAVIGLMSQGVITREDSRLLWWGVAAYAILALLTDVLFHFRQRYALEVGEGVVNRLRADIFAKVQRQPMSFFHRVKLGRIISRVTSDVEALRVGIQDVLFVSVIQFGQMLFAAVIMATGSSSWL
jgi:ATP-binding cassette subfamily B protein